MYVTMKQGAQEREACIFVWLMLSIAECSFVSGSELHYLIYILVSGQRER